MYDILIKGGTLVDGTKSPKRTADLAISNGRVASIADSIDEPASQVIDATGKIVAPGVIDLHTHYDAQINWDPYCTNSGWHGVTTVGVGNCGFGFMPCRAEDRERYMLLMQNTEQVPLSAMKAGLPWNWETFPEWMHEVQKLPKGVNLASYMPLNGLMIFVMGIEAAKSRGATPKERVTMRDMLNEAMDAGAIGFSMSHLQEHNTHKDIDGSPMPTDQMHVEDAYYLAEVLKERGEGVIQALVEVPAGGYREVAEELARVSNRPVVHNIIQGFRKMPDFHRNVLSWLERCHAEGLKVYSQALQMRAWLEFNVHDNNSWSHVPIFDELMVAAAKGGLEAQAAMANNSEFRARAREIYDPLAMVGTSGPVESYFLKDGQGTRWSSYEGKLVGDIAEELALKPIDCFLDIVRDTQAKADFKTSDLFDDDDEVNAEILSHPYVLLGTSDGGAHVKLTSMGQYPTDNIMHMVRESGKMSLEEIHYKLSALPAKVFGLKERGTIVPGNFADIYVYDFEELNYDRTGYEVMHDLPGGEWRRVVRAQGVSYIFVNGEMTFVDSVPTGATPGVVLSNSGAI